MKKSLFFSMLAALMVLALSSCSLNEDLLKNMVGTYTDNDPDEKVTLQFYPSTDGETGRFIECRESLKDGEDSDGIEVNIHMTAFVTGTYKLTADQRLSYVYDLDEVAVFYDEDDMAAYVQRNIEYNDAHDNVWGYQGHEAAEIQEQLEANMKEVDLESWKEFYESENKDFKTLSYPDVKCDGKTFSFSASEGEKVTYTRVAEDMFKPDFFDEEEVEEIVDAAEKAGEAE